MIAMQSGTHVGKSKSQFVLLKKYSIPVNGLRVNPFDFLTLHSILENSYLSTSSNLLYLTVDFS